MSTKPPVAPLTDEIRPALEGLYDMGFNDGEHPSDDPETQDQREAAAVNLTLGALASILSHRLSEARPAPDPAEEEKS
jgi:hypothetical protein